MMEDFMNQQRNQHALFLTQLEQQLREQKQAAQREKELLAQKQAVQEEEELSSNFVFRQLIEETCGTEVCEEQKQNMEDTMLDLLKICQQKELLCIHDNVDDLFEKPTAKSQTRITQCLENFKVIHKENIFHSNKTSQISPVNAITPVLSTDEDSLIMGDEHLNTILETESNEFMKSSVEALVQILSESEVTSDNEIECDVPVNDESSLTFTAFSNPLFNSNDDFTSSDDESLTNEDIDPHYFNAESNLIESLLNRDIIIDSSTKFDFLLEEFSGELAHIDPIPLGINKTDFDPKEEIRLIEELLYDNSSPRSPEERNSENVDTILESLSPPPIPVEDINSLMEDIDLFLAFDDSMPPGIENDDYDLEGDIRFLEELLSNDSPLLTENESSNLDHFNDPSFPRPPPSPPEPPDYPDFEDSRAHGFVHSYIRASYPQLHLGNPIS
ncbi:hypothetical protein Tco_0589919 [Tanacetum coccineum]